MCTDDDALMRQVQRGSQEAFETLFERYRGPIWRFFRRRIAEPPAPRNCRRTRSSRSSRTRSGTSRGRPSGAYLFGIAWHILQAERRQAGQRANEPLDAEAPGVQPADADDAIWVRHALSTLGPVDRDILILREYDQLSYQEIAEL